MTAISTDPVNEPCTSLAKMTMFRQSSRLVMFFDGTGLNGMTGKEFRISGARHGNFQASPPTSLIRNGYNVSGTTNLLFADGHVESSPRVRLPAFDYEWIGYGAEMTPGSSYVWNLKQQ
jgi:prepilin-type processing-associated H-X9-DG protein